MFSRTYSAVFLPKCGHVRDMSTMKEITLRLKSVKSIQKITKSMKMVAAAKYARAEKALKPARVYGTSALALYEKVEIMVPEDREKHVVIGVSSDRGLCGSIHMNIAKAMKAEVDRLTAAGKEVMLVNVGDKLRALLNKYHLSPVPLLTYQHTCTHLSSVPLLTYQHTCIHLSSVPLLTYQHTCVSPHIPTHLYLSSYTNTPVPLLTYQHTCTSPHYQHTCTHLSPVPLLTFTHKQLT
ncbi:ATP synthase subunit gamma, mitochondrial-like isoform X3 [Conger conger]|uniref:ATP synthase subunit gamma, mitochondrial-like isoform X3 n=1 Tax=Conger conger TaxID=82655 RepID=UPI002A59C2E4|nr:ATP synthase subunit gamma, mitochondrial-like isoform X3 [Conger conger]